MRAEIVCNKINNNKEINISGYKHSFVVTICVALMCNLHIQINNVPEIKEKEMFCKIFDFLDKKYQSKQNQLIMYPSEVKNVDIPNSLSKQVHGTIYLLPVLLHLNKSINIFESGGCKIGDSNNKSTRPLGHIIDIMMRFGATCKNNKMFLEEYIGTTIDVLQYSKNQSELSGPLVSGVTKTALLCSLVAKGTTIILNPYLKADVRELLKLMKKIGYKVTISKKCIVIQKKRIKKILNQYYISSDVTEVITFISFAVYYNVKIKLRCFDVDFIKLVLKSEFELFNKIGVALRFEKDSIIVFPNVHIKSQNILVTGESIYSDSQPFFALILSKADGISEIKDDVWSNRMEYAREMKRAGLNFEVNNSTLKIVPSENLFLPMELQAKDLRGAAVLVLFGLQCKGTIITGCEHLERGYENFWEKLKILGVEVKTFEE